MKKYEGVLKRVREIEFKRGITYAKTDGKLYKGSKVLFILSSLWLIITCTMMILGHLVLMDGGVKVDKNFVITSSVCTGLVLIGFILLCLKQHIIGFIVDSLSSAFLVFQISSVLKYDLGFGGYRTDFYIYYLLPATLAVIFAIIMTFIAIRAEIKVNNLYKKVTENLYEKYRIEAKDTINLTDDQWDEFLKNYNPYEKSVIMVEEGENEG